MATPLSVLGVPDPRVVRIERVGDEIEIKWHGPNATIQDDIRGTIRRPHVYTIERAEDLTGTFFQPAADPTTDLSARVATPEEGRAFYRESR